MDTILVCFILDRDEHDGHPVHNDGSWLVRKKKKGKKGSQEGGAVEMTNRPSV